MKELMVILLLLSWTGMVVAQESNDNGFRATGGTSSGGTFGGSSGRPPVVPIESGDDSMRSRRDSSLTRTRAQSAFSTDDRSSGRSGTQSMLDSRTSVRDSFPPRSNSALSPLSNSSQPTGSNENTRRQPIYLGLPTKAQDDLRQFGSVEAAIPDPFVDRITISDKNEPKQGLAQKVNAVLRGDTLVFQMTPSQLANIEDYSFDFEVPDSVKGRYRTATIEYPETLERIASRDQGTRGGVAGSSFESDDKRWRLAGDINSDGNVDRTLPFDRNQRSDQNQPLDRNRLTDRDTVLDRNRSLNSDGRSGSPTDLQIALQRQQEELDREKWLRERDAQERRFAEQEAKRLSEDLARMRSQQQFDSRTQGLSQPPPRIADNRYRAGQAAAPGYPPTNYTNSTPYQNPPASAVDATSFEFMQLRDEMKRNALNQERLEYKVAQLSNDNKYLENEVRNSKVENRRNVKDEFDYRPRDTRGELASNGSTLGDRRIEADRPGFSRTVLSAGGNREFSEERESNTNARTLTGKQPAAPTTGRPAEYTLLWLMLLCSVGLNLYLWFLSRTFYSRYQELADELRETFTATV